MRGWVCSRGRKYLLGEHRLIVVGHVSGVLSKLDIATIRIGRPRSTGIRIVRKTAAEGIV
jgi:hypothetical protein